MLKGSWDRSFLLAVLFVSSAWAFGPLDRADPLDCESPVTTAPKPHQILLLAKAALANAKSPKHQREIALGSLVELQRNLNGPLRETLGPSALRVFEGEIFDVFFDHFAELSLMDSQPNYKSWVVEAHGARLSKLLTLYKKLADHPDDESVALASRDRYRIRVTLDSLLLDIGKYHGWKEMDFRNQVPAPARDWHDRYFALRSPLRSLNTEWPTDTNFSIPVKSGVPAAAENPFKKFDTVREALKFMDHEVEAKLHDGLNLIFKKTNPSMTHAKFVDETWSLWAKISGFKPADLSAVLEKPARADVWDFRSAYFMTVGNLFIQSYMKELAPRVETILSEHFRGDLSDNPIYQMLHNHSDRLYGNFEWIWQISDGDSMNRRILADLYEVLGPVLRSILAYKHLISILALRWDGDSHSLPQTEFSLSFQETKNLLSNSVAPFSGLLLTLRSTADESTAFQSVLRELRQ